MSETGNPPMYALPKSVAAANTDDQLIELPPPPYADDADVAILVEQHNFSTFQGIYSEPVAFDYGNIGNILLGVIAGLFFIGVFYILPLVMISFGVQNNAVVCESPCVGNCSDIQRFHVLHTPSIGISVPQALIVSGALVIVVATIFVITMYPKYFYSGQPYKHYKLVYASEFLILFIWSCICIVIVSKMDMQCKNYNDATGDASVVSMEPDLLLGTGVSMLILSLVGFYYYIYYSRV